MKLPNKLLTPEETTALIKAGNTLVISATESLLRELPEGNWIGGTIPYFMTEDGGLMTKDKLFVSDISTVAQSSKIETYTVDTIRKMPKDAFDNGFIYLIMPGMSKVHSYYAMTTHDIEHLMAQPVFGWISGVDLDDLGKVTPKVVKGETLSLLENEAVALHVELPEGKTAELNILNIFEPDPNGDIFMFSEEGFSAGDCKINGEDGNLLDYIKEKDVNIQLPLVADFSGASINTSIQALNKETREAALYAPVIPGIEYTFAKPIDNYMDAFTELIKGRNDEVALSCNCILNYLYAELEGQKLEDYYGPFTFGEIAYMLVNQTLVYLKIE